MWKITYGRATDYNIIRRMRYACWITKATDAQSEYVVILAFPWQTWLRERVSIVRYTYISCLIFWSCTEFKGVYTG
jgi:hypothetical protein